MHLIEELLPVDAKEPLAFLDIVDPVFQVAEALPEIRSEELFDQNLLPNVHTKIFLLSRWWPECLC